MTAYNNYQKISKFGSNLNSPATNPLSYCIGNTMDQQFLHGGISGRYGQQSRECQLYLGEYCAKNWDGFCEIASQNQNISFPNSAQPNYNSILGRESNQGLTSGDMIIQNAAANKYLINMNNAYKLNAPFDPTVADSPTISWWVGTGCGGNTANAGVPEYAVDPTIIDSDLLMDKILQKPYVARLILVNIYNTMKRLGTLNQLKGTKLGNFFNTNSYFKSKGGIM